MEEMKEVFISYHEKSAGEYVAKLAKRLESAGISCWYAKRDLPSGESFADYIPEQIKNCKVFLLILNGGTSDSLHIKNEVTLAFSRLNHKEKITILPYQIEECNIAPWLADYYLLQIQCVSAETMDMGALATEVAHKLGREPLKTGWCGPSVRWTLKDNVLTICVDPGDGSLLMGYDGETKMGDFYLQEIPEYYNTPWWSEREEIISVIIENGVDNIGENAFYECKNLISVSISGSVAHIGHSAFAFCSSLTSVNISHGVTSIGNFAFTHCSSLKNVNIPDSVTNIGIFAFEDCSSLTSVNIPDSVTSIEWGTFRGCINLKSVSIPVNVEIIEDEYDNEHGYFSPFDPTTEVIRRPLQSGEGL